ncbi:MAG: bifunctional protein-serine/threonine kinase/phosphatase [Idiomarina sp.]|nr:bifunctional protein-serine/threonine kinase/phosphatase [Idiomarina sp.]
MSGSALELDYAVISKQGGKQTNEDFAAAFVPEDTHQLTYKGAALALADGVSSAEAGQQASSTAVTTFLADYPDTPDTWSVQHSAEQVLSTINLRLYRHSHAFSNELKGHLCTFTSLILKSRTAHVFHVGDSRAYQLRGRRLQQLTQDHSTRLSAERSFLARALGMDNHLQLDYAHCDVAEGDVFLLCTDGLYDFVSIQQIQASLSAELPAKEIAEALYQLAMDAGCDDNVSVIVSKVTTLPDESIDEYNERLTQLPFPPALSPGMKVDGFTVTRELFVSARSQLYLVTDSESGEALVMKTPSDNYNDDSLYIDRFIREEWIGCRIRSPYVVRVIRQPRPRTFLYYLMEHVTGVSLEAWLKREKPIKPARALRIIEQITEGLRAFHACEAIHQDLKPGNILVQPDDTIKIVDFGSVHVAGVAEIFVPIERDAALGTAEYSDPHYLMGHNSAIQGDIYALATISYELFTGKLPYGPRIAECRTAADYDRLRYINARTINPRVPVWLDRALEKGVSFDLQHRYSKLDDFVQDIKQPNPDFLRQEVNKTSRNSSLLFWQLLSGFWFVTLLLVIYLFVLSR